MNAVAVAEAPEKEMRLGQQVRVAWVRELDQALDAVGAVVVIKVGTVPTRDLNQLRQLLEPMQGSFHMVKNSLCRVAFRNRGWEGLDPLLEGGCAIIPLRGDVAAACKVLVQFSKGHEGFVLRGGRVGEELLQAQELLVLAHLPSRQVLLGQVAAVMISPIRNLAVVLQAPIRSLALVFSAVARKKGEEQKPS